MKNGQQTQNWPELAISLYELLTGRGAEIAYQFEEMNIRVPSGTGPEAQHADWQLNGTLRIRTRDKRQ